MCLKISRFVKILEWICKFPACVCTLLSYTNVIFVFYHIKEHIYRLIKVSACVRKFWACVWKFPDFVSFLELVRKFSVCVQIFFLNEVDNSTKSWDLLKISAVCLEIFYGKQNLYYFSIVRHKKLPDFLKISG